MHFGERQSLCLLNFLKSKNALKQVKVWNFWNLQLNLRSWKTWKGHEKSHGIWRAQKSTNPTNWILENTNRRGVCGPFLFQFIPFDNYLVISTVTYSVKIYTPNTSPVNDLFSLRVDITGEGYLTTGVKTVLDEVTTPETETQGYVISNHIDCVWWRFKTRGRNIENMAYSEVFVYISKCLETR